MNTQDYQPNQIEIGITQPYYLQQHETTKTQISIFFSNANTAE